MAEGFIYISGFPPTKPDPLGANSSFLRVILISQGETYTKYLGRIFTGTSMLIAVLTTVVEITGLEPVASSPPD